MKNQSGTIKTNLELDRVVMGGSGGYRRLTGGSDHFSLQTHRQTLIIIYIYHHHHYHPPGICLRGGSAHCEEVFGEAQGLCGQGISLNERIVILIVMTIKHLHQIYATITVTWSVCQLSITNITG